MSGRQWKVEPPAGLSAVLGHWKPSFVASIYDIPAKAELVFFFVPRLNRWCALGFQVDATNDHTLQCVVMKHRADQARTHWYQGPLNPPSNGNYARTVACCLIPGGSLAGRLVVSTGRVSAGTQNVLTCTDFGGASTWSARTGPWGSVTYGMETMVWTGSAVIGGSFSDTRIARSTNLGDTWSTPHTFTGTITKVVTNGMGTVLAFTTNGSYARSTDHGATWSNSSIPSWVTLVSFLDAIWFGGNFVVMNADGDTFVSSDGTFWTARSRVIRDPSMTDAKPVGRSRKVLAVCGQVLCAAWAVEAGGSTYPHFGLLWSLDAFTWHQSGAFGTDFAPATDYTREVHLASSSPSHKADAYTGQHQLVWYPGALDGTRGLFSPIEFRGIAPVPDGAQLDVQGD